MGACLATLSAQSLCCKGCLSWQLDLCLLPLMEEAFQSRRQSCCGNQSSHSNQNLRHYLHHSVTKSLQMSHGYKQTGWTPFTFKLLLVCLSSHKAIQKALHCWKRSLGSADCRLVAVVVAAMLDCLMTEPMWSLALSPPSKRENEEHPWSQSQGLPAGTKPQKFFPN